MIASIGLLLSGLPGCTGAVAIPVGGRVTGEVVDAQGRPAAGVEVRVFAGTRTDGQGREMIPQTPERTSKTDAFGRFQVTTVSEAGPVMVEAVLSDDMKAIAQAQIGSAYHAKPVTLKLGPTADVKGRLTISEPPEDATIDGAILKIPGTGYAVQLGLEGAFVFPKVAAGSFRLVADKVGVGHAEVERLEVAGQPVDLGELPLRMQAPEVKSLRETYGGPGTVVTVWGAHFMPRSNETVHVRFGEVIGTDLQVRGEGSLSVKVPAGARTAPLTVQVGDRSSGPGPQFQVVARIEPYMGDPIPAGQDFDVSTELFDTEGQPITSTGRLNLAWRVEGDAVLYREEIYPRPFLAVKAGEARLIAQSGTVEGSVVAKVLGRPETVVPTPQSSR